MTFREAEKDAVLAASDLCDRAGAYGFNIGHAPHDPHHWHAIAFYQGEALVVSHQPSASAAAIALARRLLTGAACRMCGRKVSLREGARAGWCQWQMLGPRWVPGCDAPPMELPADQRGDMRALQQAIAERIDPDQQEAS
jgi:hypothetical protein